MRLGYDLMYLARCALIGQMPEKHRVEHMSLDQMLILCERHSLTALVCEALEMSGIAVPQEWITRKMLALRKILLLDAERESLCKFMERQGIWYMPLKGVILEKLYPKLGLRQMSDNDILYDAPKGQMLVAEYMKERGYTSKGFGKGNHDVYIKEPVYNFEMHSALFNEMTGNSLWEYYVSVKERLLPDCEGGYGYHFKDEDFYIYLVAHEYKHFKNSGTGVRSLIDGYVYLCAKPELDREYVKKELTTLGIAEYEANARLLGEKLLGSDVPSLTEEEEKLFYYYLDAGTYGTFSNLIEGRVKRLQEKGGRFTKIKYLWGRLFPPLYTYRLYYPFFYKHKWLLPIGWLYRLFRAVFCRNDLIRKELSILKEADRESKGGA